VEKDDFAHFAQHCLVRPRGFRHEVVKRLMLGWNPLGVEVRGNRFDAFSRNRQKEPPAVVLKPRMTIGVT